MPEPSAQYPPDKRSDRRDVMPRIVVASPPFMSHARPLSVLASALRVNGADVHFACAPDFAHLADEAGVRFEPLVVARNANTGVAEATRQDAEEAARLGEFLDATRDGAVAALLTQAHHRRQDMLAEPEAVLADLRSLDERLHPDWYLVDQLSYPVTLALHCLGAPYASFCPGHPGYVLSGPDAYFGMPYDWPRALRPTREEEARLLAAVRDNDEAFTTLFAAFARRHAPSAVPPGRAFALTSPYAVLYSYPALPWLPPRPAGPEALFAGHTVGPVPALNEEWQRRLRLLRSGSDRVVLVALGTFLSARDDVLRTIVRGVLEGTQNTSVVVAAGKRTGKLSDLAGERAVVLPSVPQQSLLEHVDVVIHHGGNNSFTESVRAGVPALVLPFSSDQFAVARDAERTGTGVVLDPNTLTPADVPRALEGLAAACSGLAYQAGRLRERGPRWGAARLMAAMGKRAPSR
ncbi:glycosyltransferase [Streptomyces sp. NPDC088788]|uniref:glycosyltransferase n=1 Tax=Streptomyces sp. NPDC088788 TaxID=3365898 RepID=UPI0037FF5169